MTTRKLNWLAVVFGAAGMLAAILTAAMTPALGASAGTAGSGHAVTRRPASGYSATLRYIDGTDVAVPAGSVGQAATKCPRGMYAIGGGPSSTTALGGTICSGPVPAGGWRLSAEFPATA